MHASDAVSIENLSFTYEGATRPLFEKFSMRIPRGSRVLLVGANGVGKSTLLRLIAGQHLLPPSALHVFGKSPFHALGSAKKTRLVDSDFPLCLDLSVREILDGQSTRSPQREKEIIELLGIDPSWRMNRVSEGQRRRVQLMLALREPVSLFLIDEVTSHLDVVIRSDLLSWLKQRTLQEDLTIIYATHILDGLGILPGAAWPTHVAFLDSAGRISLRKISELRKLHSGGSRKPSSLFSICESMIRKDLDRAFRLHGKREWQRRKDDVWQR